MKKAKKGDMPMEKIVIIIIVMIVVISVLMFTFKANLNQWVKSLPGYAPPEDKAVDLTQQPADKVVASGLCPVEVGFITGKQYSGDSCDEKNSGAWKHPFEVRQQYVCIYGPNKVPVKTQIYWDGSQSDAKLRVKQAGGDDQVGWARGRKIGIYQEVIDQSGSVYDEVKDELPPTELLKNLNGAYYYSANRLCRVSEVKP